MTLLGMPENQAGRRSRENHGTNGPSVVDEKSRLGIFAILNNPRPAPLTNDLRPQRLALGLTQVAAATALGLWPTAISRIELGTSRDRDAAARYREWLEKHAEESN